MKIHIEDIPEDGLQLNFSGAEDILSEALAVLPAPTGVHVDPHVRGSIHLGRKGAGVAVSGAVSARMNLECARCLTDFAVEKTLDLSLTVGFGDGETQLDPDSDELDEGAIIIEGPFLNLGEIIVQELLLEVPMKPLCREDCPGLCPRCGALLGSLECTCTVESPGDPRWAALARLKKKGSS